MELRKQILEVLFVEHLEHAGPFSSTLPVDHNGEELGEVVAIAIQTIFLSSSVLSSSVLASKPRERTAVLSSRMSTIDQPIRSLVGLLLQHQHQHQHLQASASPRHRRPLDKLSKIKKLVCKHLEKSAHTVGKSTSRARGLRHQNSRSWKTCFGIA